MTKTKRSLTEAGIAIETRTRTDAAEPIVIHRTVEFGGISVSCMRHRDSTITLNIKRRSREGEVYMDFGIHLTPAEAMAISQLVKGCANSAAEAARG